ncbi:MAG: ribonuclease HII [Candidatus Bipolaricaulaceae bacterium]
MPLVLGFDEAGRGALLGPLVVAGAVLPEEALPALARLGVRESKAVARAQRPRLLRRLWAWGVRGGVVVLPAPAIDQGNLTQLELAAALALIRRFRPQRVLGDPPVPPRAIPRFRRALALGAGLAEDRVLLFPKADAQEPLVAVASLLAKVVRDGYVGVLRRAYGDFGWGYPGERKAREFLARYVREHGELPPICRRRWRSVPRVLGAKLQEMA